VVLCGAGVSVGAPASVPSWWHFNEGVLKAVLDRFQSERSVPARARRALCRLNLEALDLVEFSQVVHDAFAGATWFGLLAALDSDAPNATHLALASLASDGVLRTVATTNFDRLLEAALVSQGVDHDVVNAMVADAEPPTRDGCNVVKLHGTVGQEASLVDLASQKRRGLPDDWLDWLEEEFASSPVLVLGFSGADLAFADDYLRLKAAAARTPWLRWLIRPGSRPHSRADEVVRLCGSRGGFVFGELPLALAQFGVAVPAVDDGGTVTADDRLAKALRRWLDEPVIDADTCGIALARLLDVAGVQSAAQAVRSSIRTRAKRALRKGVGITEALRVGLVLGQVASDTTDANPAQALRELDLSRRALQSAVRALERKETLWPDSARDHAHNMANIHQNMAYAHIRLNDLDAAETCRREAQTFFPEIPGHLLVNHQASDRELAGAIDFLRGNRQQAQEHWKAALALARACGNERRATAISDNLGLLDLRR
jgi:tetratricopeptide (TPR) repeat protein